MNDTEPSSVSLLDSTDLLVCPCGEKPSKLSISETLSGKWIDVSGDCCGEWSIETRNSYATGIPQMNNAIRGWNMSPRAAVLKSDKHARAS